MIITGESVELATNDAGLLGVAQTGGYVLGLAGLYLLLHRALSGRLLARIDPFVATVLVLAPLGVLTLSIFPAALRVAVGLYIGLSLILSATIRYGGCEVVAQEEPAATRPEVCRTAVEDNQRRQMGSPNVL